MTTSTLGAAERPMTRGIPAGSALGCSDFAGNRCAGGQASAGGWWVGELQGDSILESEYLLLKWILGQENDPDLPKVANFLRGLQNEDGGWSLYPGGPADISGTVKAYFALKLMGDDPDLPHMTKGANQLMCSLGGAEKCNTFTRFYFACLGQISFDSCPSIPPEVVFLPKWFYFNLYQRLGMDAHDDFAAGHRDHASAGPPHSRRAGNSPSCISITPPPIRWGRRARDCPRTWRDAFSADRSAAQALRGIADSFAARAGDEGGGEMAAGAHGKLRGAGRDFPADGLHPDRASRPWGMPMIIRW